MLVPVIRAVCRAEGRLERASRRPTGRTDERAQSGVPFIRVRRTSKQLSRAFDIPPSSLPMSTNT